MQHSLRLSAIVGFCLGCQPEALAPTAELLVQVYTDAPVPLTVSRLRVDVFDAEGAWFDTRDFSLASPASWPASFGLFSGGNLDRTAVIRLRAYAEGSLRDYCIGADCHQSAPDDLPYDPRETPRTLAALCAAAPQLPWGGTITQRRGATPIAGASSHSVSSGSVAVRVTAKTAGPHSFRVTALRPNTSSALIAAVPGLGVSLRRDCEAENTELPPIAGNSSTADSSVFVTFNLEPGDYSLITGGDDAAQPADVAIGATSALESSDGAQSESKAVGGVPVGENLAMTDESRTPITEPLESAAIDRLVLLETIPNAKRTVEVRLASDCFGMPAQLVVDGGLLQAPRSLTCIDTPRQLDELLPVLPPSDRLAEPTSLKPNSWGQPTPCVNEPPASALCVGGGAFVLGGPDFTGFGVSSSMPERVVLLSPFFLDRYEVTIAKFCNAVASDFIDPGPNVLPEEPAGYCTDYLSSGVDASLAVSDVSWYLARSFCKYAGGDLPTEAQWEFAATLAGRLTKTIFPWGDEQPDCSRAVYGRSTDALTGVACQDMGIGPLPVAAREGPGGDETPQGIVGLGGGVAEWVLDAAHSFGGSCWSAVTLEDPLCWEPEAVLRSQRGHGWTDASPGALRSTARRRKPPHDHDAVGFRCAYKDSSR